MTDLPALCIWGRITNESGQAVETIIARKEAERRATGTFWWGFGSSLGDAVATARGEAGGTLPVILTPSLPRSRKPGGKADPVLHWTRYRVGKDGPVLDVPAGILVLSPPRDRYAALICEADTDLTEQLAQSADRPFDDGAYRTYGLGKPVGGSQGTALVRRVDKPAGGRYRVAVAARLVEVVEMVNPIPWEGA